MTQFYRNNFCVNIHNEKDSPLLPKFKEWLINNGHKGIHNYFASHPFMGMGSLGECFGSDEANNRPLYTLAQLSQLMPEIWGDAEYKCNDCGAPMNEGEAKTFTCCDDCWKKHYNKLVPDEQVQQWKPEWGKEYEFSDYPDFPDRQTVVLSYVGVGKESTSHYGEAPSGQVGRYLYIRPILTLSDKIQAITDNAEMTQQILKVVEGGRG